MMTAIFFCLMPVLGQEGESFEAFFTAFAQKRDGINCLEAPFTQKTITPDEVLNLEGTLVYAKPRRLLLRYKDPELVYLMDGLRTFEYDAELKQLIIREMEDKPEVQAIYLGFDDNTSRLQEAYNVRVLPPKDPNSGGKAIELTFKDKASDMAFFESVTVQVRAGDYLPTEIHIVNDSESEVFITVGPVDVKKEVDSQKVKIFLPEGTLIDDNETTVETVGPGGKYVPSSEPGAPNPLTRTDLDKP